jgi:hypothetical protein
MYTGWQMSRMVRKQVYIDPRQEETLKRLSRQLGIPESEIIRQSIDQFGRVGTNFPLDIRAWEEEKAFIAQRRRLQVPQTGRGWTREELYDERLDRISP